MPRWWPSLQRTGRVTGLPTSTNGASSFHLAWPVEAREPLVEASATLEVVAPPVVRRLYFWALQVTFSDGKLDRGGAHLGLQAHPDHPGGTAVNWGGYAAGVDGGGLLPGSASTLPSALSNDNTRDMAWLPRRPYRLRIAAAGPGAWEGSVTDTATGEVTVVRQLFSPGDRLRGTTVWSEVFARCDDPSVVVRWSGLEVVTRDGRVVHPDRARVTYQPHEQGGCANTTTVLDDTGVLQITAAERTVAHGTVLDLRRGPEA